MFFLGTGRLKFKGCFGIFALFLSRWNPLFVNKSWMYWRLYAACRREREKDSLDSVLSQWRLKGFSYGCVCERERQYFRIDLLLCRMKQEGRKGELLHTQQHSHFTHLEQEKMLRYKKPIVSSLAQALALLLQRNIAWAREKDLHFNVFLREASFSISSSIVSTPHCLCVSETEWKAV